MPFVKSVVLCLLKPQNRGKVNVVNVSFFYEVVEVLCVYVEKVKLFEIYRIEIWRRRCREFWKTRHHGGVVRNKYRIGAFFRFPEFSRTRHVIADGTFQDSNLLLDKVFTTFSAK